MIIIRLICFYMSSYEVNPVKELIELLTDSNAIGSACSQLSSVCVHIVPIFESFVHHFLVNVGDTLCQINA